jgi:hypothetical protein
MPTITLASKSMLNVKKTYKMLKVPKTIQTEGLGIVSANTLPNSPTQSAASKLCGLVGGHPRPMMAQ